jgi:HD-like signal output (HDOD) protein
MNERRKYFKGPSNVVYTIDGASYGMDDRLVEAIRASIRAQVEKGSLVVPRLPGVAGRILQLSQRPDVDIGVASDAVKGDPLLAARVLTLANSAALGGTGQVRSLDAAILRLGLRKLRDVVFAESMQTKVFPARAYRPLLEQSWRRSLGAAVACEAISGMTGVEREAAFLIGLLHDTGKPTLVNTITEYERKNGGRPLGDELVEIVLSQLHEEIGAHVLAQWQMPAPVVDAAGMHHRYLDSARATPAHRVIYAANLVCDHLGIGDEQRGVYFNTERVFADLGLSLDRVEKMLESVQRDLEALLAGFGAPAAAAT